MKLKAKSGVLIIELILLCSVLLFYSFRSSDETPEHKPERLKALIIDGQNNHYIWPKSTMMMKDYLEQTGIFEVEIYRTDTIWLGDKYKASRPGTIEKYITEYPFHPEKHFISYKPVKTSNVQIDFSNYDVIVSNFGNMAAKWPETTQAKFVDYMKKGGGLVVVHAADNSWAEWEEFNKMIALGGWGGRDHTSGSYAYYDANGKLQIDNSEGLAGSHGPEHEFVITICEPEHPIMKGLPRKWLHAKDELYTHLRGPFEKATILATSETERITGKGKKHKSGQEDVWNVPVLMTIEYGEGRVFHSTLGHFDYSMECAGFITTFQRGAEWAARGVVSQSLPDDFPAENSTSSRKWNK